MSHSKHHVYHLGLLGTFCSGSGQDVDYVRLPSTVISRAAGLRAECTCEADLREALTAHWEATGRRFNVEDVLEWAMDQSAPMGPNEVTANLRQSPLPGEWMTQ